MKNLFTPGGMYCLEIPIEEQMKNMQEGVAYFVKKSDSAYFPSVFDVLREAARKWMEGLDAAD